MILMRATYITRAIGRGGPLKIETFLGPLIATSEESAISAQKCGDFQGQPLPLALVMDLPPSRGGGELYYVSLLCTAYPPPPLSAVQRLFRTTSPSLDGAYP